MSPTRSVRLAIRVVLGTSMLISCCAFAGELRLPLPKKSKPTEVQKLNQQGVAAVRKHHYEEARKLFYRAYLIDPNDPFTLNNLGYISELDGEIDRAHSFYQLAAQNSTDATIAASSDEQFLGKPVSTVAGNAGDQKIQVNRLNAEALSLLLKDRAPEADTLLLHAYQIDPRNPFTLNNFGYAKEKEGELELAIRYYTMASAIDSHEPIALAANRNWRGRPISEVAAENARNCQRELRRETNNPEGQVARLNMRGVAAINRNDRALARKYSQQAYDLDATNAFTLNNMGYLAELDGDRETADYYYAKARGSSRAGNRVALATRKDLEGKPLGFVANTNDAAINTAISAEVEAKRRQGVQALLRTRKNNAYVVEPTAPPAVDPGQPYNVRAEFVPPEPEAAPPAMARPATSSPGFARPTTSGAGAPASGQPLPSAAPAPSGGTPLPGETSAPYAITPANTWPSSRSTTSTQTSQPAANPGNVLPPLPDNQQPPAARGTGTQPAQTLPRTQQQNANPVQPGDVLPPLPDDQQPR
jgi:Flp pilus assembly protein TadD